MKHSYLILGNSDEQVRHVDEIVSGFENLKLLGSATDYEEGIDAILEHRPDILFLVVDADTRVFSLRIISELYRYLKALPKIIVVTNDRSLALDALSYGVFDYLLLPLNTAALRKSILKYEKVANIVATPLNQPTVPLNGKKVELHRFETAVEETVQESNGETSVSEVEEEDPEEVRKPLVICVKSYGDYRFIEASDVYYLQADNNSTDIHLRNGEMITAFKTLKHFETVLPSPFVRIHNSYIVNIDYVSRIHTGNAVCYLKNSNIKLPFSKSYKENVDAIISSISNGNYLEI